MRAGPAAILLSPQTSRQPSSTCSETVTLSAAIGLLSRVSVLCRFDFVSGAGLRGPAPPLRPRCGYCASLEAAALQPLAHGAVDPFPQLLAAELGLRGLPSGFEWPWGARS
jgi:hypothetical protein